MDKLEQDALERDDDMATQPPDGAAIKDASQRFVGAKVRKEFADIGFILGKVIGHIPPNSNAGKDEKLYDGDDSNDVDNDQGMFGERFLVEYSNGVRERLRPEVLLDLIVADEGDDGDGELFPSLAVLSVTITFVVDIYNSVSIIVTDLLR